MKSPLNVRKILPMLVAGIVMVLVAGCSLFNPVLPPVGPSTNPYGGLYSQIQNADAAVNVEIDALIIVNFADPAAVAAAQAAAQKAYVIQNQFEQTVAGYEAQDDAIIVTTLDPNAPTKAMVDAANSHLVADLALLKSLAGAAAQGGPQLAAARVGAKPRH